MNRCYVRESSYFLSMYILQSIAEIDVILAYRWQCQRNSEDFRQLLKHRQYHHQWAVWSSLGIKQLYLFERSFQKMIKKLTAISWIVVEGLYSEKEPFFSSTFCLSATCFIRQIWPWERLISTKMALRRLSTILTGLSNDASRLRHCLNSQLW